VFLRFQEENTFWQQIPSRVGNQQLSIHITRLLDYLKSSDIFGPRKLFLGKNSSPEKSLQKNRSIFGLKNPSCDWRDCHRSQYLVYEKWLVNQFEIETTYITSQ